MTASIFIVYSTTDSTAQKKAFEQFGALDMQSHEKAENIDKVKVYHIQRSKLIKALSPHL